MLADSELERDPELEDLEDRVYRPPAPANGARPGRRFRPEDLTLYELEETELAIGLPMDKWDSGPSQSRVIRAMGWIILRRSDPALEFDSARMREIKLGELESLIDLEGADPTDPTSSGAGG